MTQRDNKNRKPHEENEIEAIVKANIAEDKEYLKDNPLSSMWRERGTFNPKPHRGRHSQTRYEE